MKGLMLESPRSSVSPARSGSGPKSSMVPSLSLDNPDIGGGDRALSPLTLRSSAPGQRSPVPLSSAVTSPSPSQTSPAHGHVQGGEHTDRMERPYGRRRSRSIGDVTDSARLAMGAPVQDRTHSPPAPAGSDPYGVYYPYQRGSSGDSSLLVEDGLRRRVSHSSRHSRSSGSTTSGGSGGAHSSFAKGSSPYGHQRRPSAEDLRRQSSEGSIRRGSGDLAELAPFAGSSLTQLARDLHRDITEGGSKGGGRRRSSDRERQDSHRRSSASSNASSRRSSRRSSSGYGLTRSPRGGTFDNGADWRSLFHNRKLCLFMLFLAVWWSLLAFVLLFQLRGNDRDRSESGRGGHSSGNATDVDAGRGSSTGAGASGTAVSVAAKWTRRPINRSAVFSTCEVGLHTLKAIIAVMLAALVSDVVVSWATRACPRATRKVGRLVRGARTSAGQGRFARLARGAALGGAVAMATVVALYKLGVGVGTSADVGTGVSAGASAVAGAHDAHTDAGVAARSGVRGEIAAVDAVEGVDSVGGVAAAVAAEPRDEVHDASMSVAWLKALCQWLTYGVGGLFVLLGKHKRWNGFKAAFYTFLPFALLRLVFAVAVDELAFHLVLLIIFYQLESNDGTDFDLARAQRPKSQMSVEDRLRQKEVERRKKSGDVAADFVSKMFASQARPGGLLGLSVEKEDPVVLAAATYVIDAPCSAETDRLVLCKLYAAMEGEKWRRQTNWCEADVELSEWYGISCDEDGRVTDIDLGENNLSGRFPICLGKLDKLLSFYVDYNYIRGTVPPTLGKCTGLRDLCLNNNLLTGDIPDALSQLRDLEILNLESNQFVGQIPSSFGAFSRLVCLDLRWNAISGTVPASLGDCKQLQELWLQGNHLQGKLPSTLGCLPNLEWLGLSQNAIEGVEESRQMFQGKYGSRVGIFLDAGDNDHRRKRSAPATFQPRQHLTAQERAQEDRWRRARRFYSQSRGSIRRASMQMTGNNSVDVLSPHGTSARTAYEETRDSAVGNRGVVRRRQSAPALVNLDKAPPV